MSSVESEAVRPQAGTAPGWEPVPGPADRESFFAAQARNRRATWRLSALCAVAVLILGIPLSAVITPLLYGAFFVGLDVVNLVAPTPDLLQPSIEGADALTNSPGPLQPLQAAAIAALLLGPGALFLIAVWLGMRLLFLRSGVGGMLLGLGARPPRPGDLEEMQLGNVVAEMGIAAGLPPPRLMLLDVSGTNAAAVGSSPADATLVVSRGLLDQLDRDQTQAVVAHLVASAGNGDLRIAMAVASLFQALGLVSTLLSAPFGSEGRRTLGRLLRFVLLPRDRGAAEAEAEALAQALARGVSVEGSGDIDQYSKQETTWRDIPKLPLLTAYMAFWLSSVVLNALLVGPPLALAWRTRRYLADASAVQLTRNPDALAHALARVVRSAAVPGAGWASHLFLVSPGPKSDSFGQRVGIHTSFDPPLGRRLYRLLAMGSTLVPPRKVRTPAQQALVAAGWIVLLPVGLLLAGMALAAAALSVMVSLAIDMLILSAFVILPLHWLLRLLLARALGR